MVFYPVKKNESLEILKKLSEIYFKGLNSIPAFTPAILESLFVSHFKRRFESDDAFSLMLQAMENPYGDFKIDNFFIMAAEKTGFYNGDSAKLNALIELSKDIFSDIERYSEER
jgi:hypothetical protein